jgi:hypothetical protein
LASQPLFLVIAMQSIHDPLEAPAEWIAKYDWIEKKDRRIMVCRRKIGT